MKDEQKPKVPNTGEPLTDQPICGIVMPISAIDGCTEAHWSDVQDILSESIESAGFKANIVRR